MTCLSLREDRVWETIKILNSQVPTLNLEAGYKLPGKFCHMIHITNHIKTCHTPSLDKDSEMELKACVSLKKKFVLES